MGISLRGQRLLGAVLVAVAYVVYSIPEPNEFSFNYETVANPTMGDLFSLTFVALLITGVLLIFRSYYSRADRGKIATQSEPSQID